MKPPEETPPQFDLEAQQEILRIASNLQDAQNQLASPVDLQRIGAEIGITGDQIQRAIAIYQSAPVPVVKLEEVDTGSIDAVSVSGVLLALSVPTSIGLASYWLGSENVVLPEVLLYLTFGLSAALGFASKRSLTRLFVNLAGMTSICAIALVLVATFLKLSGMQTVGSNWFLYAVRTFSVVSIAMGASYWISRYLDKLGKLIRRSLAITHNA